ncbi:TPA: nucleotidyltransferase [Salmonella enterica]|nr:nucleotidyltransferase [Salmonella enterica]
MAYQVSTAFNTLMNDFVNLDPEDTKGGRRSRDWLVDEQLLKFQNKDDKFPFLHGIPKMWFGSFSRRTKIRQLDDIDMMIIMHAQSSSYTQVGNTFYLTPGVGSRFNNYLDDSGQWINSRRIVNKFVSSLNSVPQYSEANSKRQGEAATLKLKSYTWNFDIVPAFITNPDSNGDTFYLIPDGDGNWKQTDPRIDKERTTRLNQKHDGKLLNVIRLVKYWKRKRGVPAIGSYLLETIMLNRYDALGADAISDYLDIEFRNALVDLSRVIIGYVGDQKNFQGDINHLSWEERFKVQKIALEDAKVASEALSLEFTAPYKSGRLWQNVLGNEFPVG